KLAARIQARNQKVQEQPRRKPEAGLEKIQRWAERHKIQELIQLRLEEGQILLHYPAEKTGQVVTKLPHPNPAQRKILQALQASLPRIAGSQLQDRHPLHSTANQ
ncbi:MAG: hypothetical protein ACLGQU_01360, partial [Acidobacteriota bacterium]